MSYNPNSLAMGRSADRSHLNIMPEIDLRNNPWNPGIPLNTATLSHDLYLLLAIFSASKEICSRRISDEEAGSVYGYSIHEFELSEVGRLFVSLAASCRNDWEHRLQTIDSALQDFEESPEVGVLIKDLNQPDLECPLLVRESWNKILHCHTMNFQRSGDRSIYSGYLEPHVHFYGEWKNKDWKASIDVYRWCEVVHALT